MSQFRLGTGKILHSHMCIGQHRSIDTTAAAAAAVAAAAAAAVAPAAKLLHSCPTLCDPMDGSPPGSRVPGILQARTLEWVDISFSNA